MISLLIQFILAFLLCAIGIAWFVWFVRNPLRGGIVGLSFFSFCLQFPLGIILSPFEARFKYGIDLGDVVYAFGIIYSFWLTAAITALLLKSPQKPAVADQKEGPAVGKGVFANLSEASRQTSTAAIIILYVVLVTIRLGMMYKYGIGASGLYTVEAVMAIPYYLHSIWSAALLVGQVFIFVALMRIISRRGPMLVNLLVLSLEILYTFTQGRRPMFIALLLILFAFAVWQGKAKRKHFVMLLVVGIFAWYLVFPVFFFMRREWQSGRREVTSMMARAIERTIMERSYYEENIQERLLNSLDMNYFIAHQLRNGFPTVKGGFIKLAFFATVPRVIYPEKLGYTIEPDMFLDENYGLFIYAGDIISNLCIFAQADFGWMGGFIYGFLFVIALRFVEYILRILSGRSPMGFLLCFSIIATCPVLQMEFTPNDLLINIRNIVLIFLIFYAFSFMTGKAKGEVPQGVSEFDSVNEYRESYLPE